MIELERHAFHDNQELDIHRLSGLQFGLQFIAVQPRPGKTGWRAPEMPPNRHQEPTVATSSNL